MGTLADYYASRQLAQSVDVEESIITNLEAKGVLQPTVKNGKKFFSSRQAYLLRAALRLAHKDKIALEAAFVRLEERWLAEINRYGS